MILILYPHIRLNTMLFENSSSDISFYSPFIKYYDYKIYSIFILVFPIHFHSFLLLLWSVYIYFLYLWHWFCFKTLGFTYIISNPVVKCVKVLYQISRYHYQLIWSNINTCSCAKYLNGSDFLYGNSDKQYFSFVFFFLFLFLTLMFNLLKI
jgi:hypothetical protein